MKYQDFKDMYNFLHHMKKELETNKGMKDNPERKRHLTTVENLLILVEENINEAETAPHFQTIMKMIKRQSK